MYPLQFENSENSSNAFGRILFKSTTLNQDAYPPMMMTTAAMIMMTLFPQSPIICSTQHRLLGIGTRAINSTTMTVVFLLGPTWPKKKEWKPHRHTPIAYSCKVKRNHQLGDGDGNACTDKFIPPEAYHIRGGGGGDGGTYCSISSSKPDSPRQLAG